MVDCQAKVLTNCYASCCSDEAAMSQIVLNIIVAGEHIAVSN